MSPDRGETLNLAAFFPFEDPPRLCDSFARLPSQGV